MMAEGPGLPKRLAVWRGELAEGTFDTQLEAYAHDAGAWLVSRLAWVVDVPVSPEFAGQVLTYLLMNQTDALWDMTNTAKHLREGRDPAGAAG